MNNKPTRYRLYDDRDGVTWAAESETAEYFNELEEEE